MAPDSKAFRKTLADRLGLTARQAESLVEALGTTVVALAERLRGFAIPGFGTFAPIKHNEKIVEDLTDSQLLLFPPQITVDFFPSSLLKKKIAAAERVRGCPPSVLDGQEDTSDIPRDIASLPEVARSLAALISIEETSAATFIKMFFSLIEETLENVGSVAVKGFGKFDSLSFTLDSTLAEEVNEPFAMFSPVEIAPGIDRNLLLAIPESPTLASQEVEEQPRDRADERTNPTDPADGEEHRLPTLAGSTQPSSLPVAAQSAAHDDDPTETPKGRRTRWWVVASVCLAILLMFAVGYILGMNKTMFVPATAVDPASLSAAQKAEPTPGDGAGLSAVSSLSADGQTDTLSQAPAPAPQTDASPPTTPAPPKEKKPELSGVRDGVRYETVTATNFLTSMAKKYYGNPDYWVFIYLANESALGHPDHVPPGTEVVIPPFERFAESNNDSINLDAARWMADEIYKSYDHR